MNQLNQFEAMAAAADTLEVLLSQVESYLDQVETNGGDRSFAINFLLNRIDKQFNQPNDND